MSNNKNIILGYSGHAYVVAEAAFKADIAIHYYADKEEAQNDPFNLDYLGYEGSNDFEGWNKGFGFILGTGNNDIRFKIGELVTNKEEELLTVIHPSAEISKCADVGKGTFVSSQASVNALSKIGKFVILNTNCVIEHECYIADGVHIAPGAVLAGNVKVGKGSFIGANAVVKEGVTIGENVIVGAGATIINDIPHNKKMVGNPGREI
ncbi:sugar O-acyltransferase, sialic acid O-acetyltransferase NeuD family [Fodinibius roseus]|uniref:Sugar O-acyltransferase, sialic acid O-acetyltransferase NeuD family n=1 Tax=Fodinibius roseus TaxID=1194090 RepID=A0A1M5J1Z3_9BACT|nr:acetyltransferase [Fodinibius roseus]SHG34594.1 sugar O-acyltransferase, sialic acid O-acetyltransferase NeuD family [Fodinibius roseus]